MLVHLFIFKLENLDPLVQRAIAAASAMPDLQGKSITATLLTTMKVAMAYHRTDQQRINRNGLDFYCTIFLRALALRLLIRIGRVNSRIRQCTCRTAGSILVSF